MSCLSLAEQYQYALSQLQAASILRPDLSSRDTKPDPNLPSSFYRPAGAPITPISPGTFTSKPENNQVGLYSTSDTRPLDYHQHPYYTNNYNPFFGVPSVLPVPVLHQAPPTPSPDRTTQHHQHHHPFSALALSGATEEPPSSSSSVPSGSTNEYNTVTGALPRAPIWFNPGLDEKERGRERERDREREREIERERETLPPLTDHATKQTRAVAVTQHQVPPPLLPRLSPSLTIMINCQANALTTVLARSARIGSARIGSGQCSDR
eukprot:sb/3468284/